MAQEYAEKSWIDGVIVRTFDPFGEYSKNQTFDNDWWQNHTPQATVAAMNAQVSHLKGDKFYHIFGINEPTSNAGNRRQFAQWLIDYMDLAREAGYRLCLGELATAKTLERNEIANGVWDAFLQASQKHTGYHILGVHEYSTGWLPASQMTGTEGYPRNLDDFEQLRDENLWYPKLPIDRVNGEYPGNWHLGRVNWLLKRADEIGVSRPKFVLSECAYDYMADIDENHDNWFRNNIVSKYKTDRYDIRGVLGHEKYHKAVLNANGMNDTQWYVLWGSELYKQHRWLADANTDECLALCLFTWDVWWDTSGYRGFDMSVDRMWGWRQHLEAGEIARASELEQDTPEPETPMDFDTPRKVKMRLVDGAISLNVRTGAGTSYSKDSAITSGDEWEVLTIDGNPADVKDASGKQLLIANTYLWRPFRKVAGGELRYVAEQYVVIEDVVDPTPDPTEDYYIVDFLGGFQVLSESAFNSLIVLFETMLENIKQSAN